ncbi:neuronal acetylcholine receptor subunit alpha-4-like [Diadema antillarum]|uniref:neuronal acetylcholine receptor subunit alpha-4-like n=1 Tax=Diadema antillarum TaxID=105358 RepID=UPI003A836E8A
MWKSGLENTILITLAAIVFIQDKGHCFVKYECASKNLSEYLSAHYGSTSIRPVRDPSQPVLVNFRVLISQIIEFDERKQHINIDGWRRQDWRDEFLQWDPADYGGLESITYNPENAWTPNIQFIESVDKDFISISDNHATLYYDGRITWFTPLVMTGACQVEIRYFPFDLQTCKMTFMSWLYDSSGLVLHLPTDEDASQNVFLQNGVWSLEQVVGEVQNKTYACCEYPFSQIVYELTLRRSYLFYLLNIILPSGLLAIINCLVFLLPSESGERVQFAVANLLAALLFQQLIGGIMPPLGNELPLIGLFLVYMVLTNCFGVTSSIVILRCYHQCGEKAPPLCLRRLCFIKRDNESALKRRTNLKCAVYSVGDVRPDFNLNPVRIMSLQERGSFQSDLSQEFRGKSKDNPSNQFRRGLVQETRSHVSTEMQLERNRKEWQALARMCDIYLFIFVVVVTLVIILSLIASFLHR